MTPDQIKAARQALGLTQAQLGAMLDTDGQTIRRMESAPDTRQHRKPAVRMARLIHAYLDGYRPADWPDTPGTGAKARPAPTGASASRS